MQVNQQSVRFNRVLTEEINKKVLEILSVQKVSLVNANHSSVSVNRVLTE